MTFFVSERNFEILCPTVNVTFHSSPHRWQTLTRHLVRMRQQSEKGGNTASCWWESGWFKLNVFDLFCIKSAINSHLCKWWKSLLILWELNYSSLLMWLTVKMFQGWKLQSNRTSITRWVWVLQNRAGSYHQGSSCPGPWPLRPALSTRPLPRQASSGPLCCPLIGWFLLSAEETRNNHVMSWSGQDSVQTGSGLGRPGFYRVQEAGLPPASSLNYLHYFVLNFLSCFCAQSLFVSLQNESEPFRTGRIPGSNRTKPSASKTQENHRLFT